MDHRDELDAADQRDRTAAERDVLAAERETRADHREDNADAIEAALSKAAPASAEALLELLAANAKDRAANRREIAAQRARSAQATSTAGADWDPDKRDFVSDDRELQADIEQIIADERERLADHREAILRDLASAVGLDAATGGVKTLLFSTDGDRADRAEERSARDDADRARRDADEQRALGRRSAFVEELLAVTRTLIHADTIDKVLADVVSAATRVVAGCDAASFSMVGPDGEVTTTAVSDPRDSCLAIDNAQYEAGQGPCLEAIATQAVVTSPDVAMDARWPALGDLPTEPPCHSAVSVAVLDERRGVVLGSLNLYSHVKDAFADAEVESAVLLAAHLGTVLTLSLDAAAAERRVVELHHAVQTRDVIGQAKGILMERQRLTADQAFDVLRRASQRLNQKLLAVAEELAATGVVTEPR